MPNRDRQMDRQKAKTECQLKLNDKAQGQHAMDIQCPKLNSAGLQKHMCLFQTLLDKQSPRHQKRCNLINQLQLDIIMSMEGSQR